MVAAMKVTLAILMTTSMTSTMIIETTMSNDKDDDNDNRDDYENDNDDNDGDALGPSVPLRSSPSRPQRAWTEEVGRLERLFDLVKNIFLKTHPVVGRRSKDCGLQ